MSMKKLEKHYDKIRKVKFFAKKHDELEKFRDGLGCSIFIDNQDPDDRVFLEQVNNVCMYLERKLLGEK